MSLIGIYNIQMALTHHYGIGDVLQNAVTTFNIRSRYPDYKGKFYKKATKKFTENYIKEIKGFRQWLLRKINELP